jgi:hypothetical protein
LSSYKDYYRTVFATIGCPLTKSTGVPAKVIAAAETRLGVRMPAALRDYYLVAGSERRFNRCHNRLLTPRDWGIDQHRLIFMEENQRVLWWGVSIRNPDSDDPPVSQGINDEPITWAREHRHCSVFLAAILHYHAVSGGLPHSDMVLAPNDINDRFRRGWKCYGEVGG